MVGVVAQRYGALRLRSATPLRGVGSGENNIKVTSSFIPYQVPLVITIKASVSVWRSHTYLGGELGRGKDEEIARSWTSGRSSPCALVNHSLMDSRLLAK